MGRRPRPRPGAAAAVALGTLAVWALLATPAFARDARGRDGQFAIPAGADQLVVISSQTADPAAPGYLATFQGFARRGTRSPWHRVLGPWSAETGYGHLSGDRREGDGSTPTGVYGFGRTVYGVDPNPGGLHYAYHRLACGDWWDEDPYSPEYNRFVHVPCGVTPAFASWSEALWTETVAYPYFAVIRFNVQPVIRGPQAPGSGIFLHSWVGGATAGCVALPHSELLELLRWLRPSDHPVIEIGTDVEVSRRR